MQILNEDENEIDLPFDHSHSDKNIYKKEFLQYLRDVNMVEWLE